MSFLLRGLTKPSPALPCCFVPSTLKPAPKAEQEAWPPAEPALVFEQPRDEARATRPWPMPLAQLHPPGAPVGEAGGWGGQARLWPAMLEGAKGPQSTGQPPGEPLSRRAQTSMNLALPSVPRGGPVHQAGGGHHGKNMKAAASPRHTSYSSRLAGTPIFASTQQGRGRQESRRLLRP